MGLLDDALGFIDARKRALVNNVGLLTQYPDVFAARMKEDAAGKARDMLNASQQMQSVMPDAKQQGLETTLGGLLNVGGFGIVKPSVANNLTFNTSLPTAAEFPAAVANTRGAQVTPDGLLMRVQRNQLPEQGMEPSVRGGVFYLPEGAAQGKHYSTGKNGYGGEEKITGETLVKNPLFAKGGTGGKAPESAYDSLLGKGSYQNMRSDALNVNWGRNAPAGKAGPSADEFLDKYAPELSGMGDYIVSNSGKGNQLAYALQEAAVASAVRNAGHDAVLGFSKGKSGPFLSELFDVRESHYPDKFGGSQVWPDLFK